MTQAVCEKVGLDVDRILLGSDIDSLSDSDLAQAVETTTVFCKIIPRPKKHALSCN